MPKTRDCDYCGADIEPGTGTMLVRTNGQTVDFCSSKCEKNADLGREARDLNWTDAGREADRQETAAAESEAEVASTDADTDSEEATPDLEAAEAEADEESADDADTDSEAAEADEESSEEDTDAEEAEA